MKSNSPPPLRFDLQIIASWIEPGARVLDLGCGEGTLLAHLRDSKGVIGTGIEKNEDKVGRCIEKGLSVVQGDINREVLDYRDNAFDYVILSQTLQQVYAPDELLRELLRLGPRAIVSFPNFSHWLIRLQLLLNGRAPKSEQLPYDWYNTPNIRVITMKDFRWFVRKTGNFILKEAGINTDHHDTKGHIVSRFPDLRATYGIFLIGRNRP